MHNISPLIVCGISRSGTSALLKALTLHNQVGRASSFGEAPFIADFMTFLKDIDKKGDWYLNNFHVSKTERKWAVEDFLLNLYVSIADRSNFSSEVRFYVVKAFPTLENIDTFHEYLPGVRIIYIVRNGIEVVNSHLHYHGFKHLSFEDCCRRWVDSLDCYSFLEDSIFSYMIRHEELLSNPSAVLSQAYIHLGMGECSNPADYLSTTIFNSSFVDDSRVSDTASVFSQRVGIWQSWSSDQKSIFCNICGDKMNTYKYQIPDSLA